MERGFIYLLWHGLSAESSPKYRGGVSRVACTAANEVKMFTALEEEVQEMLIRDGLRLT